MECNKEEAIRARELAEVKMKNNDFEGAKKVILRAQNLYPELENISQLLSICDVHRSAKNLMLGSDKDWYGVLQVERFSDEMAIKKQYRRLALFLHPDKNRFPGAEAAFKLICEANTVLSDPQKKCLYDSKLKGMVRSASVVPPPHHFNKQYGADVKVSNGFHSMNHHQATRPSFPVRPEVFFTSCPFCCLKYQLDRRFVNTTVRCQKCLKTFTSFEMSAPEGSQEVPLNHSTSQNSGFHENGISNKAGNKVGVQNGNGFPASHLGSQWFANRPTMPPGTGVRMESVFKDKGVGLAANISGGLKVKRKGSRINSDHGGKEGETHNGYPNKRERSRKNKRKGRRKGSEESESCETSSESDPEEVIVENYRAPTNLGNPRRSSRKRQNVSYREGNEDDDDDLPKSHNRYQGNKLSEDNGNIESDAVDGVSAEHENQHDLPADEFESKETGPAHPEESLQDKDLGPGKGVKANEDGSSMSKIETNSDREASNDNSDEDSYEVEDPEFNDFDKDRDVNCFDVNQYWACYDTVDGMPRFYAKVKRVRRSPFQLCITWLEANPADDVQMKWRDECLPVGCGNFMVGKTQKMSSCRMFAQQMHCEKGKRGGSLIIHPRRGEVWALFKDWDWSWSFQPQSQRKYQYEVVEVLSDFDAVAGIRVCYLDKVGGFVSLFQRSSQSTTESFMIRPNELYRFSHCIRCFKMTGSEREGVPVGSFELDPSSLPPNPENLFYPSKTKTGIDNMEEGGVNCPPKMRSKSKEFVDLESSGE